MLSRTCTQPLSSTRSPIFGIASVMVLRSIGSTVKKLPTVFRTVERAATRTAGTERAAFATFTNAVTAADTHFLRPESCAAAHALNRADRKGI